ncbi:proline iminopeptidase-family hydrolase [Alicyclobacillus fodiniaquatilis]|uniref:Proline iminopeptidase n=1 Tax=Alicyclobacillus fodiniaquatilis TaxID=1661150 RepID=A0ABW4JK20_9BACL
MHKEGFVQVEGGRVWYQMSGDVTKTPLVVLHGGPGSAHLSMRPLSALADERPVILYDQLGCGQSDRPTDKSLWRIDRFVRELATLRTALDLEKVHLLGHSWGTMLLADYLLTEPEGVKSAVFSSPCLSAPRWMADAMRYRRDLPEEIQNILNACEASGDTDSAAYKEASKAYMNKHVCRIEIPAEQRQARNAAFGAAVYNTMWGPSEFFATGNLKDYDRTSRLPEIDVPALFTCGHYDEASPDSTRYYHSLVPGSRFHVFSNSAHMPQVEQTDEYIRVIRTFLQDVEA